MTSHLVRRASAVLVPATLLAVLAAVMVAAPSSAARPTCFDKPATIVGTAKGEVIKGTAKADVIVARGGHDIVYGRGGNDIVCGNTGNDRIYLGPGSDIALGQLGNDRLYGNAGPDRLLGGPGNDAFDGGIGVDLCAQGSGSGPRVACERPPVAPAPPAPPPSPEPIDLTNVLVIAYSDLNRDHVPNAGDVMIAELVDTDGNGPDAGDMVRMGMYPTRLQPVWPADFAHWGLKSRTVTSVTSGTSSGSAWVNAHDGPGVVYSWDSGASEGFEEEGDAASKTSLIFDASGTQSDSIQTDHASPSLPGSDLYLKAAGTGDDHLIDVNLYFTP